MRGERGAGRGRIVRIGSEDGESHRSQRCRLPPPQRVITSRHHRGPRLEGLLTVSPRGYDDG